ncbi:MAG: RNA 2',3'-cyclic phosphodiesterase [Pseudomonadota bacterium]|nr:RNA 2',3'-cyclic phosphodiesterase [Pseudomonadota bacterium]
MPADLAWKNRAPKCRVFIGLWPEPALQQQLHALGVRCAKQAGGRVIRPENIHLTLVFLGNLLPAQIEAVRRIVSASAYEPVTIALDRIGYWRKPRIVWLGPAHPPDALIAYQARLAARLRKFGFRFDERPYKPHITLLRKAAHHPDLHAEPLVWQESRLAAAISVPTPAGVAYRLLDTASAGTSAADGYEDAHRSE